MYNNAAVYGGALFNAGHTEIDGSAFLYNSTSGQHGGAVYNLSWLKVKDATFSLNDAAHDGGGLYHERGWFSLENCAFNFNLAAGDGGGAAFHYTDDYLQHHRRPVQREHGLREWRRDQ